MIITIAGEAGSGKGTLRKMLSEKLGIESWSMGDMRREIAKKHGLTIHQLNEIGEKEDWTDLEVDNFQKQLGNRKNIIVEGRLSWYFIPNSYKIYLSVSPEQGAKRIFEEKRHTEPETKDIKEMIEKNKQRKQSDIKRYSEYYNINPYEKENFDLIIDTTNKTPEEVLNEVLEKLPKE